MKKRVMVFIEGEGGGDPSRAKAKKAKEGAFREAWGEFLKPLRDHASAAGARYGFQCVACGSGASALSRFKNPLRKDEGALRILLIDAERAVSDITKPWHALGENPPAWAGDKDLYLMVQCLESWLVADIEAVQQHYDAKGKPCFDTKKIPKWQNVELIHRHTVQSALENATTTCGKPYTHADGNVIIGRIKLEDLKNHLRSAGHLYNRLKERISEYAVS